MNIPRYVEADNDEIAQDVFPQLIKASQNQRLGHR